MFKKCKKKIKNEIKKSKEENKYKKELAKRTRAVRGITQVCTDLSLSNVQYFQVVGKVALCREVCWKLLILTSMTDYF